MGETSVVYYVFYESVQEIHKNVQAFIAKINQTSKKVLMGYA
ncbi:hypothetical protein [Peribacillus loiseleuriae]